MNSLRIVEVGPRDGLQNEKTPWSVRDRITFINLLSQCAFQEIEVGSFVSPKWVPQMAETDIVFKGIQQNPDILYSCLVPNQKGLESALACGMRNISLFTAASEIFNNKNTHCSIEESFTRFSSLMKQAKDHQLRVRGYISCVIECPYTGPIAPPQVALLAKRFLEIGCDEISLGDTIGKGTPLTIKNLLKEIRQEVPMDKIAIHCHDTYGRAMDNILTALEMGVQVIDSAMGGLGGCPYAGTEAKGNIATEELVSTLQRKGYLQGFDTPFFAQASAFVAAKKKNLL